MCKEVTVMLDNPKDIHWRDLRSDMMKILMEKPAGYTGFEWSFKSCPRTQGEAEQMEYEKLLAQADAGKTTTSKAPPPAAQPQAGPSASSSTSKAPPPGAPPVPTIPPVPPTTTITTT